MPITVGQNSCGAATEADSLYDTLLGDETFDFPDLDLSGSEFAIPPSSGPLYDEVDKITLEQLTEGTISGNGVFDTIMRAASVHLESQFQVGRISGREYSEVYTAAIQSSMSQAVSFLNSKDQAYWAALTAQAQARTAEIGVIAARVQLENTKLQYITLKANAKTAAADFALKKIQLSLADVDYCNKLLEKESLTVEIQIKKYTLDELMPLQKEGAEKAIEQTEVNIDGLKIDNDTKLYRLEQMFPVELQTAMSNMESAAVDRDMKLFQLENILPWTATLTQEQAETARAQTLGNRSDGAPVGGAIGMNVKTAKYTLDNVMPEQLALVREQVEVQRAQTADTRRDGQSIEGAVGKQKDLVDQQIISYQKDAEAKAGKMFLDAWLAQKAINESLDAPNVLGGESVNEVMNTIKVSNVLGPSTPWTP